MQIMGIAVCRLNDLLQPEMWCATNDRLIIRDEAGNEIGGGILVLQGDVLGSGSMNISQVVRVAQALTGVRPLEGAYLKAGDFNGTGKIDIADLVAETALLIAAAD